MNKDPVLYLDHIIESINAINGYVENLSKEEFLKSPIRQDAVCRRLEIIGEASNKLNSEFTEKHPHIHWYKIRGMRNLLIHEYFHVDLDQVWNTVKISIPELKSQILEILTKPI
jgi:uncharacterized protein with HEPN domain